MITSALDSVAILPTDSSFAWLVGPSTQQFREPSPPEVWQSLLDERPSRPAPSARGALAERGKIQPPREVEYRLDRDVVQEWRTKTL
jgi:hypothetical protein